MDFIHEVHVHPVHDSLMSGRAFRTLNILDDFNREALWIEVETSLPAQRVIRVLDSLAQVRGYPARLRLDNTCTSLVRSASAGVAPLLRSYTRCGPELISRCLADWAER